MWDCSSLQGRIRAPCKTSFAAADTAYVASPAASGSAFAVSPQLCVELHDMPRRMSIPRG